MADFRSDIDFYEILQVHPRAGEAIIRKAYRTLILDRAHPDQGGTEERAKLLNEAYAVLSDPERRAAYDRFRATLKQDAAQNSPMVLMMCPVCGKKNRVPRDLIGQSRCGNCKADFAAPPGSRLAHWRHLPRRVFYMLGSAADRLPGRLAAGFLLLVLLVLVTVFVTQALGGWLPVAHVMDRLGRKETAVVVYRQALSGRTGYWDDRERWAELELELARPEEALAILDTVVGDNPSRTSAYLLLGQAYSQLDRWSDAARALRQVVAREPFNTDAHFHLGHAYARSRNLEGAAYHFRQVLLREPRNAAALFNLGTVYAHLGQIAEAIAAYRAAADADTSDSEALVKLGELYARRSRWSEAYEVLRGALSRHPRDPEGHYTLAQVFMWQGRNREALVEFQASLQSWQLIPETDRRPDMRAKMDHAQRMVRELSGRQ